MIKVLPTDQSRELANAIISGLELLAVFRIIGDTGQKIVVPRNGREVRRSLSSEIAICCGRGGYRTWQIRTVLRSVPLRSSLACLRRSEPQWLSSMPLLLHSCRTRNKNPRMARTSKSIDNKQYSELELELEAYKH